MRIRRFAAVVVSLALLTASAVAQGKQEGSGPRTSASAYFVCVIIVDGEPSRIKNYPRKLAYYTPAHKIEYTFPSSSKATERDFLKAFRHITGLAWSEFIADAEYVAGDPDPNVKLCYVTSKESEAHGYHSMFRARNNDRPFEYSILRHGLGRRVEDLLGYKVRELNTPPE